MTQTDEPSGQSASTSERPGCRSRAVALFLGTIYYLGFSSAIASLFTDIQPAIAFLFVGLGMITVMIAITLLCYRWFLREDSKVQFDLASMFLIVVPFAVYFAGIRTVVQAAETDNFSLNDWFVVVVSCVIFIVISTLIMLWLAEALVGISLQLFTVVTRIQKK